MSGARSVTPDAWGIVPGYEDAFGNWSAVDPEVRARLIEAMGGDPRAPGPPPGPAVHVLRQGESPELDTGGVREGLEVLLEDGSTRSIDPTAPPDLPLGYHQLRVPGERAPRPLIVSPGVCHLPEDLRTWGWAAQLYAARSRASWGMGDLGDLRELARWSAQRGAGTMLVNPLNAVGPASPRETSPYFPTSRRFLDPIYLRIEQLDGWTEVADDLEKVTTEARALNGSRRIDRDRVWDLKLSALERIWEHVRDRAEHDLREVAGHREGLHEFATWSALAEIFGTTWRDWPDRYRRPDAPEVSRFATERADRVAFHRWLQWCCDRQLAAAGAEIDLLADLPIGSDPDGADAWAWQDLLADGVTVGAPPDELGPQGQDWSLPAFVPWKLRDQAYAPFIATLRAGFRHAGGLRIDHVLGLFRMFWIPEGGTAADGTYVRQPTTDLLDILALESHRAGAWVVGEDLGTVEAGVREQLLDRRILRYQVLWFEGGPVETWSRESLASVTTHDLPTVAGVWTGSDARDQAAAGLDPDPEWHRGMRAAISARAGLDPDAGPEQATVALHEVLASAPNRVVVAQLDDALAVEERPNIPGTTRDQRPNWSLALPVPLEDLEGHPTVSAVVSAMQRHR